MRLLSMLFFLAALSSQGLSSVPPNSGLVDIAGAPATQGRTTPSPTKQPAPEKQETKPKRDPWVAASHKAQEEGSFIVLITRGKDYEETDAENKKAVAGYIKRHYGIDAEIVFSTDIHKDLPTSFRMFWDDNRSRAATYDSLPEVVRAPALDYREKHPEKVGPFVDKTPLATTRSELAESVSGTVWMVGENTGTEFRFGSPRTVVYHFSGIAEADIAGEDWVGTFEQEGNLIQMDFPLVNFRGTIKGNDMHLTGTYKRSGEKSTKIAKKKSR